MAFAFQRRKSRQSGQIGIIVVLIMIVLLTIGLSLASRTTKQVALSTQEEESTRVFNAAEVGVEQALANLTFSGNTYTSSPITPAGTNATVTYTINKQYQLGMQIFQGVSATIQLTDATHPTPGQLKFDWSKESSCALPGGSASLLVSIFSLDKTKTPANTSVRYQTYEPCGRANGFTSKGIGSGVDSNGYHYHVLLNLNPSDVLVRIKPVYNDTSMLVQSSNGGQLPVQAYAIRSSGNNLSGNENRNVTVVRSLPAAPSILDYVVFSGTTIVK